MKKKIEWNKVTWYSKLLAVFVFFLVLLLGVYIGSELQKLCANKITLQSSQASVTSKGTFLYENKDYGFSLEFPNRWKDYRIEKDPMPFQPIYDEKTKQIIQVEQTHMLNFLLKTIDGEADEGGTFVIYIHPQAEWQTNREQSIIDANTHIGSSDGGYLGENSKYAYTYSIADVSGSFVGFSPPGEDPRTAPMNEAQNVIIPSFKMTQGL